MSRPLAQIEKKQLDFVKFLFILCPYLSEYSSHAIEYAQWKSLVDSIESKIHRVN